MAESEAEIRAARARGNTDTFAADAEIFFIEVSFAAERDAAFREQLMAIPTSLELPKETVRLLREYAASALRRSPAFQRLIATLGAPVPP